MTTPLSFTEIKFLAGCGWKIRQLAQMLEIEHPCDAAGPLGDLDAIDYKRLGGMLGGIEAVLGMLATTPNAYVNREALDAMAGYVTQAREILAQEWVIELLNQADKILKIDQEPGYIPF